MPKTNWQDINDPGRFVKPVKEEEKSAVTDETTEKKKDEPEVRLKNPRFEAPGGGYKFNEACTLTVDVEYLKETTRKRVLFDLFAAYNGTDEKIESGKEGFEKDGRASVDVKLYYHSKHPGDQTPSDYYFVAKHLKGEAEVKSDKVSVPASAAIKVDFVEIADVHFHHNCALPCLDEKGELIAALASAFSYAKEHADRELVVEGHADRSGDEEYNLRISKRRAEAIKALLDNDCALWKGVVDSDGKDQKVEAEDYQQTLKSLAVKYGWPCDPGAVDNKPGPKTETGVKNFQTEYNKRFPGNEQLTVDGKVGPKTWQAVFHVLRDLLSKALKSTKLDPPPALTYGYPDGKGVYACGESSPLSGDEKSKEDRRVELVFYKKGDASPAIAPAAGRKVDKKKDPVTEKTWEKTPVKAGGTPEVKTVSMKFIAPGKTPHKQFVNLKQNDIDQGPELKLVVEVTGIPDGETVTWEATAGDANSKRNDPKTGLKVTAGGKLVEFADRKAKIQTSIKGGKAECVLACGLAGGDTFSITASAGDKSIQTQITNWRKLWYQRTYHKDATVPSMSTAETKLKSVYIEFIAESDVAHNFGAAGSVTIGNHNAATYHALLKTTHPGQCVNIIFCDKQYDGHNSNGKNLFVKKEESMTATKKNIVVSENKLKIFNPPLQTGAAFLVAGSWKNQGLAKNGDLTTDKTKITSNTGYVEYVDQDTVSVELPKNAAPSVKNPALVKLTITAASGPWGGDGGTPPHNLIVINKNDTIHSMCIMHELGHLINMVPLKGYYKCPPNFKLSDHTQAYEKMGGAGSHCKYKYDKAKSTADRYVDGRCIMFHQLNPNCELIFCPDCSPFVCAQNLQKFGDLSE